MANKAALFESREVDAALRARALLVYERLLEMHGEIALVPRREPMHELISTMLSHRTTERQRRFGVCANVAEIRQLASDS